MSREIGNYWVKLKVNPTWSVAFWNGEFWEAFAISWDFKDEDFHTIHPIRIKTPDERAD
ncbi:hypothetical protein [Vibrio harveyi]|uniref:hypothetical protein n=1 Tax=Vibrio harveyi TaxID=669 RepID=UPI001495E494|nr:hypothetical protein [Vibrio harveyi]